MDHKSLIRRLPEIAFALFFGTGLVLGGGAALAGIPRFLDAVMPGMVAQAAAPDGMAHGAARFAVPQGFAESRHLPQLLDPASPMLARRATGPVIAICIDDLGEDLAATDRAMALPKEVALSFLPYAQTTPFLAQAAAGRGHLVLAHVPMQSLGRADPGPMTLRSGMAADEIVRRLDWGLKRVPGLVGINNHEGSRFTADAEGLAPVMEALKARQLFFFDSRTGPESAVAAVARAAGVMTAGRDIFLDHDPREAAVKAQLEKLVRQARRSGVAIAIGHPHDATLRLLSTWLAQDHGVTLVPLDEAMRAKTRAVMASR